MEVGRSAAGGCIQQEVSSRHEAQPLVWGEHDRVPDSGRWLFVVDRRAWDDGRETGVWVRGDVDPDQMGLLLPSVFADRPSRVDLLVVDQLGFDEMVDEDYFVPGRLV